MSYQYSAINSKHQKHPKTYFHSYLHNAAEPRDNIASDTPAELEAELLENSFLMRNRMRRVAQRIRDHRI